MTRTRPLHPAPNALTAVFCASVAAVYPDPGDWLFRAVAALAVLNLLMAGLLWHLRRADARDRRRRRLAERGGRA